MEMNVGKMSSADCWSCAKIADRMIGSVIRRCVHGVIYSYFYATLASTFNTPPCKNASHQILGFLGSFPIFNFAD